MLKIPEMIRTCFILPFCMHIKTQILFKDQQIYKLTMDHQQYADPKISYSKITFKKRLRLIQMVQHKKYSIYKASKQLGISNSTAKLIIKNYREQGHIFRKKEEKRQSDLTPKSEDADLEPLKEDVIKKENCQQQGSGSYDSLDSFKKTLFEVTRLELQWLKLQIQKLH